MFSVTQDLQRKKIYKCPWNAVADFKSSFPYTSNAEIKTCVQSEVRQVLDDICFEKEKYLGKLSMKALGNMKYFFAKQFIN